MASLSDGAAVGMNKIISAVVGDACKAIRSDAPQLSLVVLLAAHDAPFAQANSPAQESSKPDERVKELIQVDEDNLGEGDQLASAPMVDKGKTIMIDDSGSDGQVAPTDI